MIDSKSLHEKSTIKSKNEEIFFNYVTNNFDTGLPPIYGKLYHTLRVTKNCEYLSRKLNLSPKYGTDTGLFHDFARFTQWVKYNSFVDFKTEDHADMAINMLFDNNMINMFEVDEAEKPYLYFAIKYHNKREIDYTLIKNQIEDKSILSLSHSSSKNVDYNTAIMYSKIARDGDKIDLINRIIAGEFKISYTLNGYTPSCLNRILDKKYVYTTDVKTKLDRIFTFVGFLFDINFKESFDLFSLDDFFDSLLINYKPILTKGDYLFLTHILEKNKHDIILKYSLTKQLKTAKC